VSLQPDALWVACDCCCLLPQEKLTVPLLPLPLPLPLQTHAVWKHTWCPRVDTTHSYTLCVCPLLLFLSPTTTSSSTAALQYRQRLVALLRATAAAAAAQAADACTVMLDVLLSEIQKMGRCLEPTAQVGGAGEGAGVGGLDDSSSSSSRDSRLQLPPQHTFQSDLEEGVYLISAAAWEGASNASPPAAAAADRGSGLQGAPPARPVAEDLLQWCWSLVFDRTGSYQVRKVADAFVTSTGCAVRALRLCACRASVAMSCCLQSIDTKDGFSYHNLISLTTRTPYGPSSLVLHMINHTPLLC
jgi:hypothetical protein